MHTDPVDELAVLVRSRHGLAVLRVEDEDRAEAILRHLADRLGVPYFRWSRAEGLVRQDATGPVYNTQEPARALAHVRHADFPAVYHFRGMGPFVADPVTTAALDDAVRPYEVNDGILVLTGDVDLPEAVRRRAATVRLAPPAEADYHQLLGRILRDVRQRQRVDVTIDSAALRRLYTNLRGLTLFEAEKVLT
ncbi:MAG: hypothetical protein ACLFRX_12060, partial [Gemmatimonadota bacterium]